MADKKHRIAILLRGPQCTGKSSAGRQLAQKEPISLDDGDYDRLRVSDELLVIELGYGEEPGKPGPTRDPGKWQQVLVEEGRVLSAFYFVADRAVREARASKEVGRNVSSTTLSASDEIHRKPEVRDFAKTAGISEHTINTSAKSPKEVADEIRAAVLRDHPDVHWPSTQS